MLLPFLYPLFLEWLESFFVYLRDSLDKMRINEKNLIKSWTTYINVGILAYLYWLEVQLLFAYVDEIGIFFGE